MDEKMQAAWLAWRQDHGIVPTNIQQDAFEAGWAAALEAQQ